MTTLPVFLAETELLGAGVVSAPAWRGERQFVIRRTAGQEHALLLVVDTTNTAPGTAGSFTLENLRVER